MEHWLLGAARSEMPEPFLDSLPEDHPARIMLRALEAIATGAVTAGSAKDNLHLARTIASDALQLSGHPSFKERAFTVGDMVRLMSNPGIQGDVEAIDSSIIPGCIEVRRLSGELCYFPVDQWERIA